MSLSIELFQMFGMGITSINDLITNTLGACLGYFTCKFIRKYYKKTFFHKILVLIWRFCFIIMVSIQLLVISYLFKLG